MKNIIQSARRWYQVEIWLLDRVRDVVFLVLRAYFGYRLILSGRGKLTNPEQAAADFRGWEIPYPELNVYLAGLSELFGGLFLALGLASRVSTLPVIVTMLVAYMTAHSDQWAAFWTNTPIFFKAPPFAYLFTATMVLLCGPGRLSLDYIIGSLINRKQGTTP